MLSVYFNFTFGAYFLAVVLYAGSLFFVNKILSLLARFSLACGILSLSFYIGLRWQIAGRPPFSNMFESLIVFGWAIAVVFIFVDLRYRIKSIGALASLLSLLAVGYASLFDK